MRRLKKEAEKACNEKVYRELLEEDSFLEDVLLPMVDKNATEQRQKRKRKKLAVCISAGLSSLAVVIIAIVVCMFYIDDTLYVGNTEIAASDITAVNQALVNTQITGAYNSITLAFNSKTLKQYYFTARIEIMTEEILADFRMVVLVDRNFTYDAEDNEYTDSFEYLGYSVEFTEMVNETLYEEIPVNEYSVKAFFDTGKEYFYITYSEISCNNNSSFSKIFKDLIIKK